MTEIAQPSGIRVFTTVWLGQLVSLVGSGLTSFALGVWAYQVTGSAMPFAFVALSAMLPRLLLSPLAGPLVDRLSRRLVMILSDVGASLATLLVAFFLFTGHLEIWAIYVAAGLNAASATFQWPAYAAATSLLVPQKDLGRANGMAQLAQAASDILAPALAGVLLARIGLSGVLLIDFATFLVALATLLAVRFPERGLAGSVSSGMSLREVTFGWAYIATRPGLMRLTLFFTMVNFLWGMVPVLLVPMVLGFGSSDLLGAVISVAGAGMMIGGLTMGAWGGPRRKTEGIFLFELLSGACFFLAGLYPAGWMIAAGAFGAHFTLPIINGSNLAIWQSRVPSDLQGRVLATWRMVTQSAMPVAYVVAGVLADRVFEPSLATNGPLASTVGLLLGTGPGRGIALMLVLMGFLKASVSLGCYLSPRLRLLEDDLAEPDARQEAIVTS